MHLVSCCCCYYSDLHLGLFFHSPLILRSTPLFRRLGDSSSENGDPIIFPPIELLYSGSSDPVLPTIRPSWLLSLLPPALPVGNYTV